MAICAAPEGTAASAVGNTISRIYASMHQLLITIMTGRIADVEQKHVRTPILDSYFALSANLGTHTFFMVMLPILFWFGLTDLGRG